MSGLAPKPGRYLMWCRCGKPLHAGSMHRLPLRPTQSPLTLVPIVCTDCWAIASAEREADLQAAS